MTKEDGRRGVKHVKPDLIQPRRISSNTPDSYGTDAQSREDTGEDTKPGSGGGR